jgi:homoserine kinase
MEAGALGCSISGAGPTLFAWAVESRAAAVLQAMKRVFSGRSIETDDWIIDVQSSGARIIDSGT